MKKYLHILALASALVLLASPSASGKDDNVTKELKIDDFTSLVCSIPCEMEFSEAEPYICIDADKKVIDNILCEVKDGRLNISLGKLRIYNFAKTKIKLSCRQLKKLELNGAISFESDGITASKTFEANLNGTSKLELDKLVASDVTINNNGTAGIEIEGISCDNIKVTVNGVGGCELEGHAGSAKLVINGIGGIDINKFTADKLISEVNGIGKISRNK